MLSKTENITAARKLVRTFASAPDPRRQARLIHATLLQTGPWPEPLEARIRSFGDWLEGFPPLGELRARSADLVAHLAAPTDAVSEAARGQRRS